MTVNIVFRVAEKECLLFDPKTALKRAFSRFFKNHLRTPLKSDVTTPNSAKIPRGGTWKWFYSISLVENYMIATKIFVPSAIGKKLGEPPTSFFFQKFGYFDLENDQLPTWAKF